MRSTTCSHQTGITSAVARVVTRNARASSNSRVVTGHRPSSNIRRPFTPQVQSTKQLPTVALRTILRPSTSSIVSKATFRTGKCCRRKAILRCTLVPKDPTQLMAQGQAVQGQEATLLCTSNPYLQPLTAATPKRESTASRHHPD